MCKSFSGIFLLFFPMSAEHITLWLDTRGMKRGRVGMGTEGPEQTAAYEELEVGEARNEKADKAEFGLVNGVLH